MTGDLRILLLEDNQPDAELAIRALKSAGFATSVMRVETRIEFEGGLKSFEPRLIISDFSLPGFDGLTALGIAMSIAPGIPFIFLSGTIGEERAVEAMRRGATDYVLKDRIERLVPVVRRALEEAEQRRARLEAEKELAATKERLDGILGSLADIVWSKSGLPPRLVYLNQAVEDICQRQSKDFFTDAGLWLEIVHPDDRARVAALWKQALEGAAFDVEYRIVRKDGELRWLHDRATPVHDTAGRIVRFDGLARDITETKLQAEKIARLSRIREVLSSINSAMLRATDEATLYREACRIAVESGHFRLAWVGVPTPDRTRVRPIVSVGHDDGYLDEVSRSLDDQTEDPGAGLRALRSGVPFVSNDIANDPAVRFKAQALERGYRSLVALPLIVENQPTAILVLCGAETNIFDQEEIALLKELSSDIAFALDSLAKERKVHYLAYYDGITGLSNRQLLSVRLAQELAHDRRFEIPLTVAFIDLDNFKVINDSLGHGTGDRIIRLIGERIRECASPDDIVARYGGDEFVVVTSESADGANGTGLCQRLLAAVSEPMHLDDRTFHVTCSVGASVFPQDGKDAETLLRNADAAMHRAKELGRNQFHYYAEEMNTVATEHLELDAHLRRALENREFALHYQPKVNIADGTIGGFEALLRWTHPTEGPISPAKFVPILESNGLIAAVGEWVLRTVCAQIADWIGARLDPVPIAVNVSTRQLLSAAMSRRVMDIVREYDIPPNLIEIEITETVLMQNDSIAIASLRELQSAGIRISIDDFGTGYSSLAYLRRLPLDTLKVDRSFIKDVTKNPEAALITRAVVSMAHSLNLKVVAEGVETFTQLAFLSSIGCDEIQGYYFSRPEPSETCTRYLSERHRMDVSMLNRPDGAPTLLFVDDEQNVRAALTRLLRPDGYRILSAESAERGLELLATNAVDLVIADQRMPGTGGVEFLSRVKDLYPDTVRIVLSGYADLKSVTDAINLGAVHKYFSKPWDDGELRREVKDVLATLARQRRDASK